MPLYRQMIFGHEHGSSRRHMGHSSLLMKYKLDSAAALAALAETAAQLETIRKIKNRAM